MIGIGNDGLLAAFVRDLTSLAIVSFDSEGRIATWNAGASAMWGYDSAEIIGRHFSDLIDMRGASALDADNPLEDAKVWGRHEAELRLISKLGEERDVQVMIRPVRDLTKKLVGFGMMAVCVDVPSETTDAKVDRVGVAAVAPPSNVVALRSAKVLMVDDDDLVRELTEDQLTDLGYEVISASSGTEALDILGRTDDIDLLFADVVMPNGIGGRELAEKARLMRPNLKVLFTSGYFQGALVKKGDLAAGVECLAKPYRRAQLVEVLGRLLKPGARAGRT